MLESLYFFIINQSPVIDRACLPIRVITTSVMNWYRLWWSISPQSLPQFTRMQSSDLPLSFCWRCFHMQPVSEPLHPDRPVVRHSPRVPPASSTNCYSRWWSVETVWKQLGLKFCWEWRTVLRNRNRHSPHSSHRWGWSLTATEGDIFSPICSVA